MANHCNFHVSTRHSLLCYRARYGLAEWCPFNPSVCQLIMVICWGGSPRFLRHGYFHIGLLGVIIGTRCDDMGKVDSCQRSLLLYGLINECSLWPNDHSPFHSLYIFCKILFELIKITCFRKFYSEKNAFLWIPSKRLTSSWISVLWHGSSNYKKKKNIPLLASTSGTSIDWQHIV